jgi:hypothetical protein
LKSTQKSHETKKKETIGKQERKEKNGMAHNIRLAKKACLLMLVCAFLVAIAIVPEHARAAMLATSHPLEELHDIAITNVTVLSARSLIMITVENQGTSTETFNVTAYYDETAILTERWQDGNSSNVFWSYGDLDRDGYVDHWDLYLISKEFGWAGPPGQNPADINLDGTVDVNDVYQCALHLGKNIWTVLGLPKLIQDHAVVTLPPGYRAIIAYRWNTMGVTKDNYTISAYAEPVQGETNTADNNFTDGWVVVSMVGDLTGGGHSVWDFVPDEYVDGSDIIVVAMCFGSWPGASPPYVWNANCDITNDAYIDGSDLIIITRHFGEHL